MSAARFLPLVTIVSLVIRVAGCDVPKPPSPPRTPETPKPALAPTLHEVAARGEIEEVHRLLAAGADPTEMDAEGATPVHAAAFSGHVEVLQVLLDKGGRLNSRDAFGFTPLHAAARDGRFDAVRLLVDRGADLEALDENRLTAAEIASMMGHADIAAWLAARMPVREEPSAEPEPLPEILPEKTAEAHTLLTGDSFRVWTSISGAQVDAEFVQVLFDSVTLRRRDGQLVRIAIHNLIPSDQILARTLAGQSPSLLAREAGRAQASGGQRPDSLALQIGREKGWTVLEGCRLLRRGGNDGDSFHILHDGKEYIIRLYYVDAPESNDTFPDRLRDQAEYFQVDESDAMRLGKEAGRFTERLLAKGPFTVVTRWEDAKGNSRLPRYFGFVITEDGDLDELLMAEGLVRLHGMRVDGPLGSQKYQALKRLEQEARRERLGAWGIARETRAMAK